MPQHRNTAERISTWLGRTTTELTAAESEIIRGALERRALARDTNRDVSAASDMGDRVADSIARVGGSWTFIIGFLIFLAAWTFGNAWLLGSDDFDPYPFIFLNLILSMIAALQAPVIMMSQNRQTERDRIDAANDYAVNLKAEIEIMALHDKLDELRHSEFVQMRKEVADLASTLARLETILSPQKPVEPSAA